MIGGACEAWLRDYRMDGLRFDSIKDVPMDMVQVGHVTFVTFVGGDFRPASRRFTKADGFILKHAAGVCALHSCICPS
jgi:hypothetical protein